MTAPAYPHTETRHRMRPRTGGVRTPPARSPAWNKSNRWPNV